MRVEHLTQTVFTLRYSITFLKECSPFPTLLSSMSLEMFWKECLSALRWDVFIYIVVYHYHVSKEALIFPNTTFQYVPWDVSTQATSVLMQIVFTLRYTIITLLKQHSPFTTLLSSTSLEMFRNEGPTLWPELFHKLHHLFILLWNKKWWFRTLDPSLILGAIELDIYYIGVIQSCTGDESGLWPHTKPCEKQVKIITLITNFHEGTYIGELREKCWKSGSGWWPQRRVQILPLP